MVVVGAPDTLSADNRWRQWMIWVRDRGGLLDPGALRPSEEELQNGAFDPKLDEYFSLQPQASIPESVDESSWYTGDPGWNDDLFDADINDERTLSLWHDGN